MSTMHETPEGNAAQAARQMLSDLMEERRWRVPQVADALDISVDIVRRWLQGKSRMQLDDMVAVARLKGADLNELFGLQPGSTSGAPADVEELIDRKLEAVISRIVMALAQATGEGEGKKDRQAYREPLSDSARGSLNKVSAARGRRRKSS
jgi:transcriptional regulator with XRE-family HTH domain